MKPAGMFALICSLTGCSSMTPSAPLSETAAHVDLPRYMGDWYVIATVPTWFEKDAANAIESYSWNEADQRIDVDYRHHEKTPDGPLKKYPQKAWVANKTTNAEWRVRPLWPLLLSYLIVDVAPDYSWAIVGVPNKKHVWILARKPAMDEALYAKLVASLKDRGYDLKDLRRVPQVWP